MLGLLRDAVEAHNRELGTLLNGRPLRLMVETEDFGVVWRAANWKLPAFAMCTGVLVDSRSTSGGSARRWAGGVRGTGAA